MPSDPFGFTNSLALRTASEPERLERDVCILRVGAVEPPHVPAAPGRALHRSHGTRPVQRIPCRRLIEGGPVLLSKPVDVVWLLRAVRLDRRPCCPPNVVRLLAWLGNYIYAKSRADSDVYVNLFIGSTAAFRLDSGALAAASGDDLPMGRPRPDLGRPRTSATLYGQRAHSRLDESEVIPGDLYRFLDAPSGEVTIAVNGRAQRVRTARGFASIQRTWEKGDVIELTLPMPVRRVVADERVRDDEERVALARGPLVYCAEWPDNNGHALDLVVADGRGSRANSIGGC